MNKTWENVLFITRAANVRLFAWFSMLKVLFFGWSWALKKKSWKILKKIADFARACGEWNQALSFTIMMLSKKFNNKIHEITWNSQNHGFIGENSANSLSVRKQPLCKLVAYFWKTIYNFIPSFFYNSGFYVVFFEILWADPPLSTF